MLRGALCGRCAGAGPSGHSTTARVSPGHVACEAAPLAHPGLISHNTLRNEHPTKPRRAAWSAPPVLAPLRVPVVSGCPLTLQEQPRAGTGLGEGSGSQGGPQYGIIGPRGPHGPDSAAGGAGRHEVGQGIAAAAQLALQRASRQRPRGTASQPSATLGAGHPTMRTPAPLPTDSGWTQSSRRWYRLQACPCRSRYACIRARGLTRSSRLAPTACPRCDGRGPCRTYLSSYIYHAAEARSWGDGGSGPVRAAQHGRQRPAEAHAQLLPPTALGCCSPPATCHHIQQPRSQPLLLSTQHISASPWRARQSRDAASQASSLCCRWPLATLAAPPPNR